MGKEEWHCEKKKGGDVGKQSVINLGVGAMAKKRWLPTVTTIIGRFPNHLPPQTHTALQPHADLPAGLSEIVVEALQLFHLSHKLVTFLQLPGDPVAHSHTRRRKEEMHNAHTCTYLGKSMVNKN